MAADKLQYSIGNSATTTLSSGISDSATSAPLVSDTNFNAKSGEGMALIDEGQATEELAYATGKVGASLTIPLVNRGLEGGSAQAHASGATVKGVLTATMWNNLIDALTNVVSKSTGAVDSSKILPASYLDTDGTLAANSDTKIATQKATKTYALPASYLDTDGTLAANSDTKVPSQKAVKTYVTTNAAADGWIAATGTWTYASASTITVPSGAGNLYKIGDKIKWTQTTVKYGVITAVADTLLTIAVNNDYTVANAAISANYYSHQENPLGYPASFAFTCSTTANGGGSFTPGLRIQKFWTIGREAHVVLNTNAHTVSGTVTSIDFSLPIADTLETSAGFYLGVCGYSVTSGQILVIQTVDGTKYRVIASTGNWAAVSSNGYAGLHFVYSF